MYSFSFELFAKPTIKTMDETIIKASIAGLIPISLAVKAKKKRSGINCTMNFNKNKVEWPNSETLIDRNLF